jgi:hypothetical protein
MFYLEKSMGRRSCIEKNRVYVECADMHRRVKAQIINHSEVEITVEFPTGAIMNLKKRHKNGDYKFQCGMLEFISDGKRVV